MPGAGRSRLPAVNAFRKIDALCYSRPMKQRIPEDKKAIHDAIAPRLAAFGADHLDEELTGYVLALWARICRTSKLDPRRGSAGVWAAATIHVIARMNFCYDRSEPVHITLGTLCDHFAANKNTVGMKATDIEKTLRLSNIEPGLCRPALADMFRMINLPDGTVMMVSTAKKLGILPPDA